MFHYQELQPSDAANLNKIAASFREVDSLVRSNSHLNSSINLYFLTKDDSISKGYGIIGYIQIWEQSTLRDVFKYEAINYSPDAVDSFIEMSESAKRAILQYNDKRMANIKSQISALQDELNSISQS